MIVCSGPTEAGNLVPAVRASEMLVGDQHPLLSPSLSKEDAIVGRWSSSHNTESQFCLLVKALSLFRSQFLCLKDKSGSPCPAY